ncbi:hypothetical protein [Helicobacter turcicus]|uniref:Periplasmic protein n=1 Tax=Helicobacter turcicus TaxID=2867412 RepID=A0ABS7JLH2_9HELI|nr:hypothetical protein [Helicobacter turcicus]MBX7490237.1 hypothetical protein [Helicobacter turcicus]MBX7545184.1 hypothetical protein [Helicobacter turcicus]
MKFKYYIGALFVFIVLLGLYVYSLSGESYTFMLPFSTRSITLPVAIWYILPVVAFFIIVVFLEAGGTYRMWRKRTKYKNDYKILLEQLENQLLGKNSTLKQPTMNRYKSLSILLNNLTFDVKEGVALKSGEARIDELIELLGDLKRGEYVNLKKFNPNDKSPFVRQNTLNQIQHDEKFATEVLKRANFDETYKRAALKKLLESDNLKDIKRFVGAVKLNKDITNIILEMCYAKKIDFSNKEIAQLCAEVGYSKQDYLLLAQKMKECYEPESWVGLFEELATQDEKAEVAYFYVLLELEMLEEARERLKTHLDNELLKVRAYLDLKDFGKKYPLELFLLD